MQKLSLNTSLSLQGVANFLGNITSILQQFEGTPSPPQTLSVDQSTPDMTNDPSTITVYDGGIPAEVQGGRRKLLQATVRFSRPRIEYALKSLKPAQMVRP